VTVKLNMTTPTSTRYWPRCHVFVQSGRSTPTHLRGPDLSSPYEGTIPVPLWPFARPTAA